MNEVIVFLWVAMFSASAPEPGPASISKVFLTQEACEYHEAQIWGQTAEAYAESDILFMFTDCLIVIPRQVRQVK